MNFLQLVQRSAIEFGVSGGAPATVVGQAGENARVVNWVSSAWLDIQIAHYNWNWLRSDFDFTTTANVSEYTPTAAGIVSRFGAWDKESIQCNSLDMEWMDYPMFRTVARVHQTPGLPFVVSTKSVDLSLTPVPSGAFAITGDYFKSPQVLALDADIPEMPEKYHMAIVYLAMASYARYEAAGEVMAEANKNYRRIMAKIEADQLPSDFSPRPMA